MRKLCLKIQVRGDRFSGHLQCGISGRSWGLHLSQGTCFAGAFASPKMAGDSLPSVSYNFTVNIFTNLALTPRDFSIVNLQSLSTEMHVNLRRGFACMWLMYYLFASHYSYIVSAYVKLTVTSGDEMR